jgi:hypothetical protein
MKTNSKGDAQEESFNLLVRASVHHDLFKSKASLSNLGSIR